MKLSTKQRNGLAVLVTVLGFSAMAGDLSGNIILKGLGMAYAFAPMPKVFCDNNGLEGFASDFDILAHKPNGEIEKIPLGPELYGQMSGPYNRRNVYGAALAGAPILPEEMWRSVFNYGFGPNGPLIDEFQLPKDATEFSVSIRTKTVGRTNEWTLHRE